MRFAGGVLLALAVAAQLAGTGLPFAAGIAVLGALAVTFVDEPSLYEVHPSVRDVLTVFRAVALLPLVAVYGSVFAAYVVPGYAAIASAGFVLVVAVLAGDYGWLRGPLRTVVIGLVVVGAVVVGAVSLTAPSGRAGFSGWASPGAIALAVLVLFPVLVPRGGRARTRRCLAFALLGVGFALLVVRVLGTELSGTFLLDLGGGIPPVVLVVFVGIATVGAAIDEYADAELIGWESVLGASATALLAAFASPVVLLVVAGAGALVYVAFLFWMDHQYV